jgi:DNA modification methylase
MYTGDPMEEKPNNDNPEKYSENNKNIGELRQDGTRAVPLEQYSKEELIQQVRSLKKQLKTKNAFGLVFERQKEDAIIRRKTQAPVLKEDKEKHVNNGGQENLLLIGDNIDSLTCLLSTHKGKIDVIYIDPPYNTGNEDFIYNDKYVNPEDAFRDSKWLSFMEPRLLLAKELLSETGVIFVSIDDNEQAQLKMLMDSIFSNSNFIANIIWDGGLKNNSRFVSVGHDYMLTYAKNKSFLIESDASWQEEKQGIELIKAYQAELYYRKESNGIEKDYETKALRIWLKENSLLLDKGLQAYSYVDESGNIFASDNISAPGGNGARYDVLHPVTGLPVKSPASGWRFNRQALESKIANGEILFGKDETTSIRYKRMLNDKKNDTKVPRSYFWEDRAKANRELKAILGEDSFDFPKDVGVIKRWIKIVGNKNSIILDFFAGSGTTGHAVLELNKEDNGSRQFILCTNDEANIGERRTYRRLKRVITGENWADGKEHESHDASLRYFNVDFVDRDASSTYGSDSTVNKLDGLVCIAEDLYETVYTSNMVTVYSNGVRGRFAAIVRDPWGLDELEKFFENESPNVLTVYVNDSFADYRQELSEVVPEGWDVSYVSLESFFFSGLKYADRLLKNYMTVGDSVVSDSPVDVVEYDEGLYSDGNNVSDLGEE